jgi:hypothetical protein
MRPFLIAAAAWPLLCGSPAFAQVGTLTPPLGATSPLASGPDGLVGTTGIPTGATELASPGVSPVPSGITGTITVPSTSSGMACSTAGTSPLGTFGSPATYDGGGMAMATGNAMPSSGATSGAMTSSGISTSAGISATSGISTTSGTLETSGLSGMCGAGSSSIAASSTPTPTSTSSTTSGGVAQTGIPLGSIETGNLGVSSAAAVPTTNVSPIIGNVGSAPTMPIVASPPTVSSTTPSTIP